MKIPMKRTVFKVILRKSEYKEQWSLLIESFPVFVPGRDKVEKIEKARNIGEAEKIPVLVYGNGLFNYVLCSEDGTEETWNSTDGYDVLIIGKDSKLELQ